MTRSPFILGAGCLAGLCLVAGMSLAQQGSSPEDGGPVLTFGISSTLSATDNYNLSPNGGDSAGLFDTRLSFGYRSRRANDLLRLDLDGMLRAIDPPGAGGRTFDDATARLGYDREVVNSALSLGAEYNLTAVNLLNPFDEDRAFEDDPLDESDFTLDQGDRKLIAARFRLETGRTDPLGFVLEGRYREQNYSGTTDPSLFDTEFFNLTGTARFTLSPITEARVVLRYDDYAADDVPQTYRQTSSVNLGLTHALSQVDTLDVTLGFQHIRTDEALLGASSTQTGVTGSFELTRELTRGTISTSFDLRESVNGRTATWRVSRALPLPRGAVEFSLGATSDVNDRIRPVGSVDFTHEMKRSTLTASLEQRVTTSSQANELRTTRASLGYSYEINSVSDLGFSANFVKLAQAGGPAVNDTTRTDLRAIYNRDLTRDWRLTSGYEYRMRDETGASRASSNRVFLTVGRNFVMRP